MSQVVARNIFSLVISKILAAILVFVGYVSVFRYLGPFGFGQYQYVLSYVMLFSIVVDFGIQQMVIKKVSEDLKEGKRYLGNFFAVEFFLALIIYILLAAIALFTQHDVVVRDAIFLAGFGMFLNALTIPYTAIVSAHQDMHKIAVVNFFDSVINVAVMFGAIIFHKYIVFLALTQGLMGLMHLVVYNQIIKKYIPKLDLWSYFKKLDFDLAKHMFKLALPFGMLVGFSVIYNKIDVIILGHIKGYTDTGLYSAAYKFFDLLAFFPAVVSSSLYPFFASKLKSGDQKEVGAALSNYTKFMIAIGLPLAFGGAVLAPKLINIWGAGGFGGFVALQILVFASATLFIYSAVNSIMVSQLTRKAVKVTFINIFINVVGNLILVPRYGIRASAFMTFFSEFFQVALYFYFVRKHIVKFPLFVHFIKPVIAALIMAAVLYPLRDMPLYFTLPLGIIIYTILILASGFFKKGDLIIAKNLISRKTYVDEQN